MAVFIRDPSTLFISGFVWLLCLLALQITRPFLSVLNVREDLLVKYEVRQVDKKSLLIWMGDDEEPFINPYSNKFKILTGNIEQYLNKNVTIWYNSNREFLQFKYKEKIILKYNWFNPWLLILYSIALYIHFASYRLTKKDSININSYSAMWKYVFREKKLIMKKNHRTYNPSGALDTSWVESLYTSNKKRKQRLEEYVISWKQFFNITGKHAINTEVRAWMMTMQKGKIFLEGYDFFNIVIKGEGSMDKKISTTDAIFDFLSTYLDSGREHYNDLGKPFKDKFPEEYAKIMEHLNRLR